MNHSTPPARRGKLRVPVWASLLAGFLFTSLPLQGALDFGDAPDGSDTAYPVTPGTPAVTGTFKTLAASNGARHVNLGEEWLGRANSRPDSEMDANVVNNDLYDNAFPPIPFFLVLTSLPPSASISFWVTVDASAPPVPRYVNILIDWDQSGDWKYVPGSAPEWAVQNYLINQAPGTTQLHTATIQWGLGALLAPQIFWVRVTLSRATIGGTDWDGSGLFQYGETEDFLFHPNKRHDDPGTPWTPPSNPPAGWTPPPGGGGNLPGIKLVPKSQDKAHGNPAIVSVELVNGNPPATLEWAVDPGQRPGFLFDPGSPKMPFGGSWGPEPSGSTATAVATGGSPLLGTITVNSIVHPMLPTMEEWPLRVRARWPGIRTQTRKAIVRIWHSGWGGIWSVWENYDSLDDDMEESVPDPWYPGNLFPLWDSSFTAWQIGDYATAQNKLGDLQDEIDTLELAGHIDPIDADRISGHIKDISLAIDVLPLPAGPAPDIVSPEEADTVNGLVDIIANTISPGVTTAIFEVTSDGLAYDLVGIDTNGADGWSVPWDTTASPDGTARLRVTMENTSGTTGGHEEVIWIDNTPSFPSLVNPGPGSYVCGVMPIELTDDPEDDLSCVMEISPDGATWYEMGRDEDVGDGFSTALDTGQLESMKYDIRATVTDEAGNSIQTVPELVGVEPSFMAWKHAHGLMDMDADDDPNLDGMPLGLEYYLDLSPNDQNALADHLTWEPVTGTDFRIAFRPREMLDGVRCKIQVCPDLSTWFDSVVDPVPNASGVYQNGFNTFPKLFVRLNVWEDRL